MTRPLFASLLALASLALQGLAPGAALADVAPMPTVLHLEGQRSTVTVSGGPDHARFIFRNDGDGEAEVFLYRALLRADGMNVPMEITQVLVSDRPQGDRRVRVPAEGQAPVTIFFELPERHARRTAWDVDLRVTADGVLGGWETSPAHITRARREPRRRKWVTGPKDPAATRRATPA